MPKFDLHMHTKRYSGCSQIDPFGLVRRAREVGLDGIVITEHDWLWEEHLLNELRASQPDLIILAGIEVSARDGDMLVYGVTDPFKVPKGIGWSKLCDEVHRQGGVAVAAHPYRWNQRFDEIVEKQKPALDGMELMSSNMDAHLRQLAATYQARSGLPGFGNSDAHAEHSQGIAWTEFEADIRTNKDLVAAIRSGKLKAVAGR